MIATARILHMSLIMFQLLILKIVNRLVNTGTLSDVTSGVGAHLSVRNLNL